MQGAGHAWDRDDQVLRRVEKVKSVCRNIFRAEKYVYIFGILKKVG